MEKRPHDRHPQPPGNGAYAAGKSMDLRQSHCSRVKQAAEWSGSHIFRRFITGGKKRYIYVTVKISMGKYQDKLLTLEEKLETGLNCELVKKRYKRYLG